MIRISLGLILVVFFCAASALAGSQLSVEAYIRSANAQQGLLVRKTGKGDESCTGTKGFTSGALKGFVENLRSSGSQLAGLAKNGPVAGPDSPVEVFTQFVAQQPSTKKARAEALRALANLHQVALEVDRDGDALQFLFSKYVELKLPVSIAELGLRTDEASLIAMANELSKSSCVSPFDTSPKAWHLALRKIANWGAKYNGTRDTAVLAAELLKSPAVRALTGALKRAPAKKILMLGHSFTMAAHWSTPSAFVPVAGEILKRVGSPIQLTQITQGGLNAGWALKAFLPRVLAAHPDRAYVVVIANTDEDKAALGEIVSALKAAGIEPYVFDAIDFYDPYTHDPAHADEAIQIAKSKGAKVVPLQQQYDVETGGDRLRDLSLDGVHMTEAYHRFMTEQWLRADLAAWPGP